MDRADDERRMGVLKEASASVTSLNVGKGGTADDAEVDVEEEDEEEDG
jgi:hypothetical protein